VAAAAVWFFVFYRQPPETFQMGKIERVTNFGDVQTATISSDGRYVAYVRSVRGEQSIWLRQTATASDAQIFSEGSADSTGSGIQISSFTFTPDSNFLYFVSSAAAAAAGDVYRMPSLGGNPKRIVDDVGGRVAISPDGKQIAFVRNAGSEPKLVLADSEGGGQRTIASGKSPQERFAPNIAWSPDGKAIALAALTFVGGISSSFIVVRLAGGKQKVAVRKGHFLQSLAWLPDGSGLIATGANRGGLLQRQFLQVSYPSGARSRMT
jgi:Tol biopolymer transport system component